MLLKDKTAIVTGGSKGIGKAVVETFLKQGAHVYMVARTPGDYTSDFETAAKEGGVNYKYIQADVGNETAIKAAMDEIITQSGGVDIVVNNAGITRDKLMFALSTEDWEEVMRVNLTSAFWICKVLSRHMLGCRKGSIINMSSIVGVHGNAGQTNYSASKAGLIGMTKSLAFEVASRGVRVNAIAPGFIGTEMTEKIPEKHRDAMLSRVPLARMGSIQEIADACLFLASDLSTYVTGQVLGVDGGMGI